MELFIYVFGAIVLGTYVGLVVSLFLSWFETEKAWRGLRGRWRWGWGLSMLLTVLSFFRLVDAGFADWLWYWFLISAITWVPMMWLGDAYGRSFLPLLSVWSTALPTLVILVYSFEKDGWTIAAAFWFAFHHVFFDGIVWAFNSGRVERDFSQVSNGSI